MDGINRKGLRSERTLMPWLIWTFAVSFYAYEFLQRVSISVYLPYLIKDLNTDATGVGVLSSMYYYAYSGMQIPAGMLIDWLGVRKLATLGILIVSLGGLFFASIHTGWAGGLARFLMGFGSSFAFISVMRLIIIWFPSQKFTLMAGLTNFSGYVGATLGEVPLTYFVNHFGWRWTNVFVAILGLVLTVFIGLIVRDRPYNAPHKPKRTSPALPKLFQGLKEVLSNGKNWLNGLYAGLMVGPTSAFAALWGINFLTTVDKVSQEIAAGALSAVFIGVAVGSPCFGWLSDHLGKRQIILVFAAIGGFFSTAALIFISPISLYLIYVLCFLFGFFASAPVLNFAIAKDINRKKISGTAMGFTNMTVMLGGAALQPAIGYLLDWERYLRDIPGLSVYSRTDYHIALSTLLVSQFIAFLIALLFLRDRSHKTHTGS